jgi:hypothetical protein
MLKYEIEEYAQDFDLFPAIETLAWIQFTTDFQWVVLL